MHVETMAAYTWDGVTCIRPTVSQCRWNQHMGATCAAWTSHIWRGRIRIPRIVRCASSSFLSDGASSLRADTCCSFISRSRDVFPLLVLKRRIVCNHWEGGGFLPENMNVWNQNQSCCCIKCGKPKPELLDPPTRGPGGGKNILKTCPWASGLVFIKPTYIIQEKLVRVQVQVRSCSDPEDFFLCGVFCLWVTSIIKDDLLDLKPPGQPCQPITAHILVKLGKRERFFCWKDVDA